MFDFTITARDNRARAGQFVKIRNKQKLQVLSLRFLFDFAAPSPLPMGEGRGRGSTRAYQPGREHYS